MQSGMKKRVTTNSSSNGNSVEAAKPKERHIVSWSQEVCFCLCVFEFSVLRFFQEMIFLCF